MAQSLNVLIVEDDDDDAEIIKYTLRLAGFECGFQVVDSASGMRAEIERQKWDVILSDHSMPQFSAPEALALARQFVPEVPFIIVSGEIDLNLAVSLMRNGAKDFIPKRELVRLVPAIERELEELELRKGRQAAEAALLVSETRYRRLFETAQDGILILDADTGQVTDVNPFLIAMLGYSRDEFLGKELWELGAFKDVQTSKQAYQELQRDGYIRYDDLPLLSKDGKHKAVEFVSNIYLVDHIRIAQCNIRDISGRENALVKSRKESADLAQKVFERTTQLEAVNKELETFNYSVSHDLRAPLRRVLSYLELLEANPAGQQSPASLGLIENIRDSIEHMNKLIDVLLELARYSRVELKRQAVNLSAIAGQIAAELQQSDPERQVEFTIAKGIMANGDDQLLRILLENLISNAWKFTSKCSNAEIEFGIAPPVNGNVTYFVRDNGAGFDMNYSPKLFGAFQRLHSIEEFQGTGIGLAIVQRIINRHGGRVWAEGKVEKGATFYFTI